MMCWLRHILCLTLLQISSLTSNLHPEEIRLPGDIIPEHYKVTIIYDLNEEIGFAYFGAVEIEVKVLRPTRTIVLHADGFIINNYDIRLRGYHSTNILNVTITRRYSFLYLEVDDLLVANSLYNLTVPFFGHLKRNHLSGVLVNSYVNVDSNVTEFIISTDFKPVYARRAFPCYDEPMYKATFTLNIGHNTEYTAISNMPLHDTVTDNLLEDCWAWRTISKTFKNSLFSWHRFETSRAMSTYQVAFCILKFSRKESPFYKYIVNVWARRDSIIQTAYALTISTKLLTFMESWFNVPHAIPKLDIVAVPDSSIGCRESWGLLVCSEATLFYDVDHSSITVKREMLKAMARVMARQWFGNLVTVVWWSDAWLFDGFAEYSATISSDDAEPQWLCADTDAVDHMLVALSTHSSMAIPGSVNDERDVRENTAHTSKGFLLFRMISNVFGENNLKKGINNFLGKYAFGNANQEDLWRELVGPRHLHYASRFATPRIVMDTWITQTGYPLLTVRRDLINQSVYISQKLYQAAETDSSSWWVPLGVMSRSELNETGDSGNAATLWLSEKQGIAEEQSYDLIGEQEDWVLLNRNMIAPYRVNYDSQNWHLLVKTLNSPRYDELPVLSRVQLLADSLALMWTDQVEHRVFIDLFNYLRTENHNLPLLAGMKVLGKLDTLLCRRPDYGAFQTFVGNLIKPAYEGPGGLHTKKIMYKNDLLSVERQVMSSWYACRMNVPGCEENAVDLLREWMDERSPDTSNPIPRELHPIVLCVGAARGSISEWTFLRHRLKNSRDAALRKEILKAMACSRDISTLKMYLEWSITEDSEVRRQEAVLVISSVMRSQVGYYVAKEFLMERISDIHRVFSGHLQIVNDLIKIMLEQFTTDTELNEFLEWKAANSLLLTSSELMMQQAVHQVRQNIGCLNRTKKDLFVAMKQIPRAAPDFINSNSRRQGHDKFTYFLYKSRANRNSEKVVRIIVIAFLVIKNIIVALIRL